MNFNIGHHEFFTKVLRYKLNNESILFNIDEARNAVDKDFCKEFVSDLEGNLG